MGGFQMFEDLHEIFVAQRLGISYFKLADFSIDRDLSRALNSIQERINEAPLGVNKRIIQNFDYSTKNREIYLSALIETPVKIKTLIEENQEIKIIENIQYQIRTVRVKINLKNTTMIIFAQGQKEVKEFVRYIRDLTVNRFNPVQIKVNPGNMKKAIKQYEKVNLLKIITSESDYTDSIRFGGKDVLTAPFVHEVLNSSQNEIVDIFGTKYLSEEKSIKLHLNNRGRIWLYANPDDLTNDDLKNLTNDLEGLYFSGSAE